MASSSGKFSSRSNKDKRKPYKNNLWRQNVYEMGNVQEGQGFAAIRKQSVIREYRKLMRKTKREDVSNVTEVQYREESSPSPERELAKKAKLTAFQKAKDDFKNLQEEKQKMIEEKQRIRAEKRAAIKLYRQKKNARMKIFNKKTKKGQPALRARMDLILEDIKEQIRRE